MSHAAMPNEPPLPGSGDASRLTPLQKLRLHLSALRSEQSEEKGPWDDDYVPLGGDLRGPRESDGYAELVAAALSYAWTWQGRLAEEGG